MKLVLIIGIGISVAVTILVLSIIFSDFTSYADENIYGISAQVVRSANPLPLMCPLESCTLTHFQLIIESETPAIIEQYKICNGFSCIQNKEIRFRTNESGIIPMFEIESWKIGDMVSIKVGASTSYNEEYTHPPPITRYIDLGLSKIGGTE